MADAKLCWIDLESTGLSAQNCIPLEVGLKITDAVGFVIDEAAWLIWEPGREWSIKMTEGAADEFVGPMHQKSGLWDDLVAERGKNTLSRAEADLQMVYFVDQHCDNPREIPLAGSSIGSLDRPFVLEHFPKFNKTISYRNVDISSVKEICKAVNPELFENLKPIIGSKEDSQHRVLSDIDASITEYRAYLREFLITDETVSI